MGNALVVDEFPIQFDADASLFGQRDDAVRVDGQHPAHRQLEFLFRHEVFEILAIADRAGDVQIDHIHVVHGRRVDFAAQTEGFGQMGDLERSGDPVFPGHRFQETRGLVRSST